jgi:hypothetical protein
MPVSAFHLMIVCRSVCCKGTALLCQNLVRATRVSVSVRWTGEQDLGEYAVAVVRRVLVLLI